MTIFNSFWPVYKNLEEETLLLAKYIQFSDNQLNVYSMYIADLITRIAIEIEALSKELYRINGGPEVFDENGNSRNLYFDTDCMEYLNNKWNICNRDIIVSCTEFNFINDNYKIFKPLYKANKRGSSSAKWNIAYQAIKHDRRNNLTKGNIWNLIQALGALYILNIYYKEDELGTINSNHSFDSRLGSSIFSVSFADATKAAFANDESDMAINEEEREKINTAICIIKYTDDTWKNLHTELNKYNERIIKNLLNNPELLKKIDEKSNNIDNDLSKTIQTAFSELQIDFIRKNPPLNFGRMVSNGKKEIILNKNQKIYM